MFELMKEYYLISVLCGGVSLLFTCLGGWVLIRWLETLKDLPTEDKNE